MGYRIVVDAGHGGDDPGAVYGGLQEKNFNLEAANYMYRKFQDLGLPVAITRTDDTTLTREEKINTMRSLGTDSQVIILFRKSFDLYVRTSLEAKWSFSWHIIKNNI